MDDLPSSTAKLVNYVQSFGYDKWKYALRDEDDGDGSAIIDKLVYTDPDKFAALEITRRYCIGSSIHKRRYSLAIRIRTVNQSIGIDNLHDVLGINEFNALIARFEKEQTYNSFDTHSEMCKELGL